MFLFAFISNQLQKTIYKGDEFSWDLVIVQPIPGFDCLQLETSEDSLNMISLKVLKIRKLQNSSGPKIMLQVNPRVFDVLEPSD